jgi:cytidine deaminase
MVRVACGLHSHAFSKQAKQVVAESTYSTANVLRCYAYPIEQKYGADVMSEISNTELIEQAVQVLNPRQIADCQVGQVGSALITDKGTIYKGVCLDTGSGLGFCAERTAIAQMITNREYKVKKIVAVWNDNPNRDLYILPPCGVCRHYMFMLSEDALDIDVVLDFDKTVKLKELYPYHEWPKRAE